MTSYAQKGISRARMEQICRALLDEIPDEMPWAAFEGQGEQPFIHYIIGRSDFEAKHRDPISAHLRLKAASGKRFSGKPRQESAIIIERAHIDQLLGLQGADFVTAAYNMFLCRMPDTSGFGHYMRQLEAGVSKDHLLREFAKSPEFDGLWAFVRLSESARAALYGR